MNRDLMDMISSIDGGSLVARLVMMPPTTLRFFTPTERFWVCLQEWLKPDSSVVEVGAGAGYTTEEARTRYNQWYGIDVRTDGDTLTRGVLRDDATTYDYSRWDVMIACRPDHSGWVQEAVEQAIKQNCVAIYVGLEDNFPTDMYDLEDNYCIKYFDVGAEGEHMWVFRP